MYEVLKRFIPETRLFTNESMAKHTSFKIGGPAEFYVKPASPEEVQRTIEVCLEKSCPFTLLGGGSNVLVSDKGIPGVVIQLHPGLGHIRVFEETRIHTGAGVTLAKLAETACRAGLSGLAFASGIPGTAGGALYMNAGAYGHDISETVESADVLMPNGRIITLWKADMGFGYRKSIFWENGGIILSATFALTPGNPDEIRADMTDLNARRKEKQPLEHPSAGSVFKRPEGQFAGKLIEDCGLKGYTIGGAQVSDKHAGFIVNTGGASCDDVLRLIAHIRETVHARFNLWLEPEIRVIGLTD